MTSIKPGDVTASDGRLIDRPRLPFPELTYISEARSASLDGDWAGFGPVRPKINRRCWYTSFLAHLVLLIVLGSIFLGSQGKTTIVFQSESVDDPELQEINFSLATFEQEERPLNSKISVHQTDSTDVSIEVDFGIEPIPVIEPFEELGDEVLDYDPRSGQEEPSPEDAETHQRVGAIQKRVVDAGGRTGEVQFSLSWDTISDLDLHVITPSGDRIWFRQRRSGCNGLLDVDRNASTRRLTTTPVENIRWLKNRPQSGRYTVLVHCFQSREKRNIVGQPFVGRSGAFAYQLLAKTGENVDLQDDFAEATSLDVYRYVYFSPSVRADQRKSRLAELEKIQAEEELAAERFVAGIQHPAGTGGYYRALGRVIEKYPHTDTAIELLKIIPGRGK